MATTKLPQGQQPKYAPQCDMCGGKFPKFDPNLPTRCTACSALLDFWIDASSWAHLLEYNRDFIRGDTTSTPYSVAPIFTDEASKPSLLRLHDYGLLVSDAQPGFECVAKDQHLGQWFEIKERAYLRFVLPTNHPHISIEKFEKFQCRLLYNEDLEFVSFYEYAVYSRGIRSGYARVARPLGLTEIDQEPDKLARHKYFFSSVGPSMAGRAVAKYRTADTKEELVWKRWKKCRHNGLPVITEKDILPTTMGLRALGRECTMTIGMKPIVIIIAARNWAPIGVDLPAIVEQACKEAEMEPLFAEAPEDMKRRPKGMSKTGEVDASFD